MPCRGGVCHAGVGWGWVMQGCGGVGCVMHWWGGSCRGGGGVGWGGSCRGGVGHVGMGWGVNNFICQKLGVLSFLLTNYCQLLSG